MGILEELEWQEAMRARSNESTRREKSATGEGKDKDRRRQLARRQRSCSSVQWTGTGQGPGSPPYEDGCPFQEEKGKVKTSHCC